MNARASRRRRRHAREAHPWRLLIGVAALVLTTPATVVSWAGTSVAAPAGGGGAARVRIATLATPHATTPVLTAYVANRGDDSVLPIQIPNPSLYDLQPEIPTGFDTNPVGIAADPTRGDVYVAASTSCCSNNPGDELQTIDTPHGMVTGTLPAGPMPYGVAVAPDGSVAVTTNYDGDSVTVTDLAATPPTSSDISLSGAVGSTAPEFVAISPDSSTAYVTVQSGYLVPITIATGTVGTPIALPGPAIDSYTCMPTGIAIAPSGTTAVVACSGSPAIVVVDLTTSAVTTLQLNASGIGNGGDVAITPDGSTAVVSWNDDINGGQVSLVSITGSPTVTTTMTVSDPSPGGVAITPDGSTALVAGHASGQIFIVHLTSSPPAVDPTVIPDAGAPVGITFAVVTPKPDGYWLAASDGGIFAFGQNGFYGSTGSMILNKPIVSMAPTPDGKGYWLVASDGGIFAFGDAGFHGSTGAISLNSPIVAMSTTPDGKGYWLVSTDGGIFAFGDAHFYGSMGGQPLNKPIVGMSAVFDGEGYWLVASDGGIFAFGQAGFYGSTGAITLNRPIMTMASV